MASRKFGPNWALAVLLGFALVLSGYAADSLVASSPSSWFDYPFRGALVGLPLLLLVWVVSCRLKIDEDQISYRSIFGSKALRWNEVGGIKNGATEYRLNGAIPFAYRNAYEIFGGDLKHNITVTTTKKLGWFAYSRDTVEKSGKLTCISFGWRLHDSPSAAAAAIEAKIFPFLLRRATVALEANEEVHFGYIALSKQGIRSTFMEDLFGDSFSSFDKPKQPPPMHPWTSVVSYSVEKGRFLVRLHGSKQIDVSVAEIANLNLLIAIVDNSAWMKFQPATI